MVNEQPEVHVIAPHTLIAPWITDALRTMKQQDWRHESEVYAEAGQEQPRWSISRTLGMCPMVCPDHARHCDNNADHTEPHACSLCDGWTPHGR